jgi:hypothetical protein
MIIYPDKPWTDGQEFEFNTADGLVIGTYNETKNAWSFTRFQVGTAPTVTDVLTMISESSNFNELKTRILNLS